MVCPKLCLETSTAADIEWRETSRVEGGVLVCYISESALDPPFPQDDGPGLVLLISRETPSTERSHTSSYVNVPVLAGRESRTDIHDWSAGEKTPQRQRWRAVPRRPSYTRRRPDICSSDAARSKQHDPDGEGRKWRERWQRLDGSYVRCTGDEERETRVGQQVCSRQRHKTWAASSYI